MKRTGIKSILINSSFLFNSHLITTLLRLAYITLLTRMMGPETYGLFNYGLSWYLAFFSLTTLGLDIVLLREIGFDSKIAPKIAGSTFVLRGLAVIFVMIISTLIVYISEPNPEVKELLFIFSLALIGRALWFWCASIFTAFENTRYFFMLELVFRPLEIIVIICLFFIKHDLIYVGIAHSIIWLVQGGVGLLIVLKKITPIDWCITWPLAKELIVAGIPGGLYTLVITLFMQTPVLFYRQHTGTGEELGHFGLAMQFLGYLVVIPVLIGNATLPVLSRSTSRKDSEDKKVVLILLFFIPMIGLIISFFGMYLSVPLISYIFGAEYENAGAILSEAIWLLIPFSLAIGLQQFVFSCKSSLLVSLWGVMGILVMIILFSPLSYALSYRGVLFAIGLGLSVWAGGLILSLRKIFAN